MEWSGKGQRNGIAKIDELFKDSMCEMGLNF